MKPFSKKNAFIGISAMAALFALTIYTISKKCGIDSVEAVLKSIDLKFIVPALFCMFKFSFCEALNIRNGLKTSGYSPSLLASLKYAYTGFFFSSITPSASGGQPAQLYTMHKDGIKISHASFSLLLELFGFQVASILIAVAGLIVSLLSPAELFESSVFVFVLLLGFTANILLLSGLITVMFSHKAVKVMAHLFIGISSLFSKRNDAKAKILKTFAEYRSCAKRLRKNKTLMIKTILISLLQFSAFHSITYFCYRSFGMNERNLFELMSLQGLLFTSVSCIPLPGSTGAMEGGFGILFKRIFSEDIIGSAIILYRLISFVLPLAISGLFLLIVKMTIKELKVFKRRRIDYGY